MTSILSSHHCNWSLGVQEHLFKERFNKVSCSRYSGPYWPHRGFISFEGQCLASSYWHCARKHRPIFSGTVDGGMGSDDTEDGYSEKESLESELGRVTRENLERIVGKDDSTFSGVDLATLIRNKYGKSYDVQLIKKEFMGRNLLALNVMWKYMEQDVSCAKPKVMEKPNKLLGFCIIGSLADQDMKIKRSFPLTEEEYLLRLDDVANTLKCWGAVSHIRNSLAKLKERPRIGKAVSIFIDMDESGGRANEWIYK